MAGTIWKHTDPARIKAERSRVVIQRIVSDRSQILNIEEDMRIKDLSSLVDLAYDTTRKYYKGEDFLGPKAVRKFTEGLSMTEHEVEELKTAIRRDKAAYKGLIPIEDTNVQFQDPILNTLKVHFELLTREQKLEVLNFARALPRVVSKKKAQTN